MKLLITGALLILLLSGLLALEPSNSCGADIAVTLDIGHSPGRAGATSARGKSEYFFNRRFVGELRGVFGSQSGSQVMVINGTGTDIPLRERADRVRNVNNGVFLSIHHDSVQPRYLSRWTVDGKEQFYSDVFSGFSLFVSKRGAAYEESVALARAIGSALRRAGFHASHHHAEAIPGENRPVVDVHNGVFRFDDLAVLKNAQVPAVLIEVGIILNRDEESALENSAYRARYQRAIATAVNDFFCRVR